MSTYKELLHKREELEQAIAYARKSELVAAIANVRGIIEEYDLSSEDIFGRGATKSRGPSKAKGQSVQNTATLQQAPPGRDVAKRRNGSRTRNASNLLSRKRKNPNKFRGTVGVLV